MDELHCSPSNPHQWDDMDRKRKSKVKDERGGRRRVRGNKEEEWEGASEER
jgi:hypothetical protein